MSRWYRHAPRGRLETLTYNVDNWLQSPSSRHSSYHKRGKNAQTSPRIASLPRWKRPKVREQSAPPRFRVATPESACQDCFLIILLGQSGLNRNEELWFSCFKLRGWKSVYIRYNGRDIPKKNLKFQFVVLKVPLSYISVFDHVDYRHNKSLPKFSTHYPIPYLY